jgi:hypothetical protein
MSDWKKKNCTQVGCNFFTVMKQMNLFLNQETPHFSGNCVAAGAFAVRL